MTWYDFFEFVHVAASIVWVGGGLTFVALIAMANRKGDQVEVLHVFKTMVPFANRVFMQAAIVALVSGVVMLLILPQIGWGSPWILFGLLGFALTGYLGGSQLGPRTAKIVELEAREGASPATMALVAEVTRISRFDIILLFTIVADMVIKPLWPNWIVVILFLAIVGGAGYYFLAPILRRPTAQPPTTQPPVSA